MIRIEYNPLLYWVEQRIKKNKNAIIVMNGATGSGKSYAGIDLALKLSNRLGTSFNIKDNLGFGFSPLLKKMDLPQNKSPGTCFVFEEVGSVDSGGSARQWQGKQNLFFNSFMQTARSQNQILIFNCPMFSALEKSSRALAHLQITMNGIDYMHKKSFGKPFAIQANALSGKLYFKYIRFTYKGGNKTRLQQVSFDLPPKEVIEAYEKEKATFLTGLRHKIIDAEEKEHGEENKSGPKNVSTEDVMTFHKKGLNQFQIGRLLGVTPRTIRTHLKIGREGADYPIL